MCIGITDGSHNPPEGIEKSGFPMLSSKNIFDDNITLDEPRYLTEMDFEKENERQSAGRESTRLQGSVVAGNQRQDDE